MYKIMNHLVTILHISRQPNCRDMCIIVTRFDHWHQMKANGIFSRFQSRAQEAFVRWLPGTNVITVTRYKSSKLHLGEIKHNQYNGVYLDFKLNRLCSTMPHHAINMPSLYFNWPCRGRQRKNAYSYAVIHDITQRHILIIFIIRKKRTVQYVLIFMPRRTWEHMSLLVQYFIYIYIYIYIYIQYFIYMFTFLVCSIF